MTATQTASREARASIVPVISPLQSIVLAAIRKAGSKGLTDEEGQLATGMNPNTWRPRRIELQQAGAIQIHPIGTKQFRVNTNGRRCAVFVVAKEVER
jgi:hypothetical protein